jgi:tRNA (guanine26-N2/guanine27-N2)-dimethyltransferase
LVLNDLDSKVFHEDVQELVNQRDYDWIDIDPFGTPAPFLESVIKSVKKGGILGIAATDTAVLCGAKPSICLKRYGSYSMKKVAAKEVGVRILLAHLQTLAIEFDRSIEPLLSYSEGHHLRVFVRVVEKKNIGLKWLNYDMKILDEEQLNMAGPIWVGKIIDSNLIPNDCQGLLGRFFDTLKSEADGPVGLFDINDIARDADIGQTPKKIKIINCLQKEGFFASASVFSPLGIKTNAPLDMRIKSVKLAQSL